MVSLSLAPSLVQTELPSARLLTRLLIHRERFQVPHHDRRSFATDARRGRERGQAHCRLHFALPRRICGSFESSVSSFLHSLSLLREHNASPELSLTTSLAHRWGTKRVRINQVYQEYIQDKTHLHMNATRFTSLTEFCKHLGRTGVAHVDETEKGWFISWIDNSPRALAKAEANQKKERGDMDDETRQRKLIQEQIERARREGEKRRAEQAAAAGKEVGEGGEIVAGEEEVARELKRDEGEKVSLSLSFKATPAAAPLNATSGIAAPEAEAVTDDASPSTATIASTPAPVKTFIAPPPKPVIGFTPKPNAFKANPLKANPLKANPLKKPNPLKAGSSISSSGVGTKRAAPMSAVEAIVAEEMARKQRRTN